MSGRKYQLGMVLTAAVAVVAAGIAAIMVLDDPRRPPQGGQAAGSGEALIGGPFTLTDHTGATRVAADFEGRPMLVYFGYTYCPDVCPTGLQTLSDALDRLGEVGEQIQPVFITVDPERDTPAVMAGYVQHFHPRLVGLTGTKAQIDQVTEAYRIYYAKQGEGEDYLVDHSTYTYLMGPDGEYLTHFSHGVTADEMAERIRQTLTSPTS